MKTLLSACPLAHHFSISLRSSWLVYEQKEFILRKRFIFVQMLWKKPQTEIFCIFFKSLSLDFSENNLKGESLWYLSSNPKFYVWRNSSFHVIAQDALNRSNLFALLSNKSIGLGMKFPKYFKIIYE